MILELFLLEKKEASAQREWFVAGKNSPGMLEFNRFTLAADC